MDDDDGLEEILIKKELFGVTMTIGLDWGVSPYLKSHRGTVALITLLQIVGVAALILSIYLLKPILDEGVYGNDLDNILFLGAVLLVVTVIYSVVTAYSSFLASKVASSISKDMRNDIAFEI